MSLYTALYGNPKLPETLQCICGRTFRPDKDKETHCSTRCAREDSMRKLLGDKTPYRQKGPQQLHQSRSATSERNARKVPSRLDIQQERDESPPTPLPKLARHLPKRQRGKADGSATRVPPVPPLVLGGKTQTMGQRDVPPTPPPKSARHLVRIPRRAEEGIPPVPAMPSHYLASQASTERSAKSSPRNTDDRSQRRDGTGTTGNTPEGQTANHQYQSHHQYVLDVPMQQISSRKPVIQQTTSAQTGMREQYPIYVAPPMHRRRSASMPFLRRALDPTTKLGSLYHPEPVPRPAIYAPAAIPLSPPPAYTSGVMLHPSSNQAQASGPLRNWHQQPQDASRTRDVVRGPAVDERGNLKQSRSIGHLVGTSSSTTTGRSEANERPGDVWYAVRHLRLTNDENYRDRFLDRATPRF